MSKTPGSKPNSQSSRFKVNEQVMIPHQTFLDQKTGLLKPAGIGLVYSFPNTTKKTKIQRKL